MILSYLMLSGCLAGCAGAQSHPDPARLDGRGPTSECAPVQGGAASAQHTPRDTVVQVDGRGLHLRLRVGSAPLTVLFEAGGAAALDSWGEVDDLLAQRSDVTVVSYDRAGLGESDLGPLDLTPLQEVRAVHLALERLGLPRRTVVVGHSYGGLMALAHADVFPGDVAGLVLVDPMNPRFVAEHGAWLRSTVPDIDEPATNVEHVVVRMSRTLESLSERLGEAEPEMDIPMRIVTAGEAWWGRADVDDAWRRSHVAMAAAGPRRLLTVAEGVAHDIPGEAPECVVRSILELADEIDAAKPR